MPARLAASMTRVPGAALIGLPSMVRLTWSGMSHTCVNSGADPLVRGRPPGRPLACGRKLIPNEERVQGDPRRPGGPPHWISADLHHFAKLSGSDLTATLVSGTLLCSDCK